MTDITGNKYSRLLVKEMLQKHKQNSKGRWLTYCKCDCDCGKTDVVVMASKLKSGHTQSCGCLQKERSAAAVKKRSATHGMSNTKVYANWLAMRNRCHLETDPAYQYYGGRGIAVCDEWRTDFLSFYNWMIANGYCEDPNARNTEYTIDRIDVNGNYCPDNCRLVSFLEQANNKRDNRLEIYNGETHTIAEWARIKGIRYKTFCNRLYRGWSFEKIMTT